MPATVAYAIEIKLGLGDLPRTLQHLSVCVGTCNLLRHRLGQRRERDVQQDWDIQSMLDFALTRLARRRTSPVKMALLRVLIPFRRLGIPHPEFRQSLVA